MYETVKTFCAAVLLNMEVGQNIKKEMKKK